MAGSCHKKIRGKDSRSQVQPVKGKHTSVKGSAASLATPALFVSESPLTKCGVLNRQNYEGQKETPD